MGRGQISGFLWGSVAALTGLWVASELGGMTALPHPPSEVVAQAPAEVGAAEPGTPAHDLLEPASETDRAKVPQATGSASAPAQIAPDSAPVADTETGAPPRAGLAQGAPVPPGAADDSVRVASAAGRAGAPSRAPSRAPSGAPSGARALQPGPADALPSADRVPPRAESVSAAPATQPGQPPQPGQPGPFAAAPGAGDDVSGGVSGAPRASGPEKAPLATGDPARPSPPAVVDFSTPTVVQTPPAPPAPAPAPAGPAQDAAGAGTGTGTNQGAASDPGTGAGTGSGTGAHATAGTTGTHPLPIVRKSGERVNDANSPFRSVVPATPGRPGTKRGEVSDSPADAADAQGGAAPGAGKGATDAAGEGAAADLPAIRAYAQPFDNPGGRPLLAVILLPVAGGDTGAQLPFPVSYAVDAAAPDATERMRAYRARGNEVVAIARLPEGAQPSDVEVAFQTYQSAVPEAVAFLDTQGARFQTSRKVASEAVAALAESGRGLITFPHGFNPAIQVAERDGVPAALVFRVIDEGHRNRAAIKRFLDQAAFKAGQTSAVVLLASNRPETVAALLEWSLGNRASTVTLAPVSAALLARR